MSLLLLLLWVSDSCSAVWAGAGPASRNAGRKNTTLLLKKKLDAAHVLDLTKQCNRVWKSSALGQKREGEVAVERKGEGAPQ
jgi:hypothetical protein